ncbi:hypothetical protein [Peteryoungia ipomoeae]|uniref:Uncharacterized protein n=1 Tax=Peteryoungia ipomoeae TaxID=1210932 RepID=A0A4S8P5G7_9HYPH|nr:hypothetical protein [Peteryoungia ipomoeae]THV25417.1 hypothetical protein FAA97_04270 [Peteryoungia ipomoeae]
MFDGSVDLGKFNRDEPFRHARHTRFDLAKFGRAYHQDRIFRDGQGRDGVDEKPAGLDLPDPHTVVPALKIDHGPDMTGHAPAWCSIRGRGLRGHPKCIPSIEAAFCAGHIPGYLLKATFNNRSNAIYRGKQL